MKNTRLLVNITKEIFKRKNNKVTKKLMHWNNNKIMQKIKKNNKKNNKKIPDLIRIRVYQIPNTRNGKKKNLFLDTNIEISRIKKWLIKTSN